MTTALKPGIIGSHWVDKGLAEDAQLNDAMPTRGVAEFVLASSFLFTVLAGGLC